VDKPDSLSLEKMHSGGTVIAATPTPFITTAVPEAKVLGLELTESEVVVFMCLFTRPPISARWHLGECDHEHPSPHHARA
jgi:hypothetical protein